MADTYPHQNPLTGPLSFRHMYNVEYRPGEDELINYQAKRRKALPKFLELGNCHAVFIREDRGTTKVLIPLDFFIEMYNEWNQR